MPPTEPPPQRLPRKMPAAGPEGKSAPMPEVMAPAAQQQMPAQLPAGGHTEDHGTAAGGAAKAVDPVCGMEVDPPQARADGLVTEFKGVSWYFCTPACKQEFDADPSAHLPVVR